jgi:hypothetical protein
VNALDVKDQEVPRPDLDDPLILLITPPPATEADEVVFLRGYQQPFSSVTPEGVREEGLLDELSRLPELMGMSELVPQPLASPSRCERIERFSTDRAAPFGGLGGFLGAAVPRVRSCSPEDHFECLLGGPNAVGGASTGFACAHPKLRSRGLDEVGAPQ